MKPKTIFITAAIFILAAFIIGALVYNTEQKPPETAPPMASPPVVAQAPAALIASSAILVRMHSPTLGPVSAPVTIVEFFDPACGTCRAFHPIVKEILAANPEQVRLVLRYATFHQGSDKVVALLEASRKQGKYWEVLEALLAAQEQWTRNHVADVRLAMPVVEKLGLNMEALVIDMGSPAIAAVIAQDMEDGKVLNVNKTPGFFVNGRELQTFGVEPLKRLVSEAIGASKRQ